jgi:hypothetical protein
MFLTGRSAIEACRGQPIASQLVRALRSHTRHLASLAARAGQTAKTIHLLDYCNDPPSAGAS